ncbi:hypothetical protein Tco_0753972 [Tanacetum coccineum]
MFLNSLTQTDKPQNPQFIAPVIKPQKDYEEFNNVESFEHLLQGRLKDWYHSLGEYRQLQIQQSISPEAFMSIIYSEFIGSPWECTAHAKEEFLKMKYCFYYLNGVDDVNLKQVFLNSFPESLGNEAYQALEARNVTIAQTTLGELGHFARNCPDKKRSQALIQALNQVEPVDVSDLESLYSLDDEPSDSVLCTIAYSDFSSDDDFDTDLLESDYDFGVHMINPIPHVLPIQEDPPLPLAKVHLLTDAYAKPIPVIAFFDTADDKFPLQQKKSLFQHLADARVLSKFDLKSGFWQLAMITIFEPILANTLVYIDDILLFSPDEQSHAELLLKIYSLVAKYGIMLSEKKMEDGFSDELSSQKMIQQFLGLVNYMADFLPKLSYHTAVLFPMLKKNPPQWTSRQTEAVKAIKCLTEKMPPLKILASLEKRILQTDANDECWGAVLLV